MRVDSCSASRALATHSTSLPNANSLFMSFLFLRYVNDLNM
jgi:hypothetical protein